MSIYDDSYINNGIFTDTHGEFGAEGEEYDLNSLGGDIEDEIGYSLVNREDYINDLICWIAEKINTINTSNEDNTKNNTDINLMKEDLKTLMQYNDEYIFLSVNDNEFLIKTQCNEIEDWYKKQGSKYEHLNTFDEVLGKYVDALKRIKLQCNDIPLEEKNELFKDYLRDNVFMGMMIGGRCCQEPYDEHSLIFDEPLLEEFTFKAKEHLEKLGYKVAVFLDQKYSDRYNTYYTFAYADNKESLQKCIDYMLKQDCYSLIDENKKNNKESSINEKLKEIEAYLEESEENEETKIKKIRKK